MLLNAIIGKLMNRLAKQATYSPPVFTLLTEESEATAPRPGDIIAETRLTSNHGNFFLNVIIGLDQKSNATLIRQLDTVVSTAS